MHSNTMACLTGMMVTSALAAPYAASKPLGIEKRQTTQTYTCVLNAVAKNGEIVGGIYKEKRQPASPASGDIPGPGVGALPNTFISSTGLTIGIAGATQPLYSSSSFNVWDLHSQVLSASDTGLPMDLTYYNEGGIPTFSCGMYYNGVNYDCDLSDDIQILGVGSEGTQKGQVQFPCEMTPPGSTSDSPLFAPGWCTTHVVQHQKPDPDTDPYTLDVYEFDAAGTPVGTVQGAVTSAIVTGTLPWTLDVGTGAVDSDPVTFAYGDQTWDSNDSTNHQCSVGAYDSGSRQMDCGFTC